MRAMHPRSGREFSEPEPMNLPEHGTATDAATQLAGNSPGCHALRPSHLQMRDARIRPGQCFTPAPVAPKLTNRFIAAFLTCLLDIRALLTTICRYLSTTKCSRAPVNVST